MTFAPNPLSREQKLFAEGIVQLGNIVEQLEIMNGGGNETTDLNERIANLEQTLASVQQEKTELIESLQQSQLVITSLQNQVATAATGSITHNTPDNITQVMDQLGIEY